MSRKKILITGGAGFIGSHLADALLEDGVEVRILDSLVSQVHGAERRPPSYLSPKADLIVGDVGDPQILKSALAGVDVVVHLASAVGVGQSMYEISLYVAANSQVTANLLQFLSQGKHQVRKLVVASSMSVYGEGAYGCPRCGPCAPPQRSSAELEAKRWELRCPGCEGMIGPMATSEGKPLQPTSIYAITKRDQEEMCLCVGRAYGIPTVALRYFNVYGERQALSNPYTGVVAIFSSSLLNNHPPLIYEDGCQTRDFTHVSDIVQATLLAMRQPEADYQVFNVGTGVATTVAEVASVLSQSLDKDVEPRILQTCREGDIRHCVADISKISERLGYQSKVEFREGMKRFASWISEQQADDFQSQADAFLRQRGLVH